MITIEEIDQTHIRYIGTGLYVSRQFRPGKYNTFGKAKKAMRALMDAAGYESLTQHEKEVVGRWSLITDQNELDSLFTAMEQTEITDFQNSYITHLQFESRTTVSTLNAYSKVGTMIYNGSLYGEIVAIHVNTSLNAAGQYSIRVYDKTNNQVVAEKTGNTNTDDLIIDLGTILYQPSNQAVLEAQVRIDTVGGTVEYDSCQLSVI